MRAMCKPKLRERTLRVPAVQAPEPHAHTLGQQSSSFSLRGEPKGEEHHTFSWNLKETKHVCVVT